MQSIRVLDITKMALSDEAGKQLRKSITNALSRSDKVEVDFSGISLFATMFFNSSIGYFIIKLSPDVCKEKIKCINLTNLGKETLNHSVENALTIYKSKINANDIGIITQDSIENDK